MVGRGSRAWSLYLLAGIAATGGYFSPPSPTAQNGFIVLGDASMVAARLASIIDKRRILKERLAFRALHDPLTHLLNRVRLMEERLERALARSVRYGARWRCC